jgi:hypothetical protein
MTPKDIPAGVYVVRVAGVNPTKSGVNVASFEIDVRATVRHRMMSAGWRVGRNGHLYKMHGPREWRAVFLSRTMRLDVLSLEYGKRGRRHRCIIASGFYSGVVFFDDGRMRLGGHWL